MIYEEKHIINLLKWLYEECISAGGDGDCWWYCKYGDINKIFELVKQFNRTERFPFSSVILDKNKQSIYWSDNQECIVITTSKEEYEKFPSWAQCVVIV